MSYEPNETIAPACEACDGEKCPGEGNCLQFLKALRRERFYIQEVMKYEIL